MNWKKISFVKINITLNAIFRFNLTRIKILMTFLTKMLKTIVKFMFNNMRFWVAETILDRELKAIMESLHTIFQGILQSYVNKNKTILSQKQTTRLIEQNKIFKSAYNYSHVIAHKDIKTAYWRMVYIIYT